MRLSTENKKIIELSCKVLDLVRDHEDVDNGDIQGISEAIIMQAVDYGKTITNEKLKNAAEKALELIEMIQDKTDEEKETVGILLEALK